MNDLDFKPHFELHFDPDSFITFELGQDNWPKKKWSDICQDKNIKRIHYNTSKVRNYLIIDIDNENLYKWQEIGFFPPNFIVKNKNKKGGHLFYVLEKPVFEKNTLEVEKWQILQKEISHLCGGDPLNKGYVGKNLNSSHFEYIELEPFAYNLNFLFNKILHKQANNVILSPQNTFNPPKPLKTKKTHFMDSIEVGLVVEGVRNTTLFDKTRKYAYSLVKRLNEEDFKNSVFTFAYSLNDKFITPQDKKEVEGTAKSIIKYCLTHKDKITKKGGIMGLSDDLSKKEKQKLAAEYTNKQQKNKTLLKLKKAILDMKKENLKINVSSLARFSKVQRHTVYKYKEELKI